ncbi:RNA methyltransferase [Candidatus Similichlamydia epinepheli]|uniref:RNA methyltransferase n=1 Tax=Candidatus Similichlamydia epinepheli TaxID=1903953 RepID=UPI000D392C0B|nr:RNA methyltransferase [Candidatus Similichlamydia epinepheli]
MDDNNRVPFHLWLTSTNNPKLKIASKLKDQKHRKKAGLFLIEGYRELSRYLEGIESISLGFSAPKWVFFCSELFLNKEAFFLLEKFSCMGSKLFQVSSSIFSSVLSHRDRPDGLLAVSQIPNRDLTIWTPNLAERIAVLDRIEKPGNLGAILRSGDAAGLQAIILSDPISDIWNPNAVRSSLGALFTVPVFHDSSHNIYDWLKKQGYQLLATKPRIGKPLKEIDWAKPTAFLIGSEQFGLSSFWMDRSDYFVSIPMFGKVDSLNVSTAAAIFFFAPLI